MSTVTSNLFHQEFFVTLLCPFLSPLDLRTLRLVNKAGRTWSLAQFQSFLSTIIDKRTGSFKAIDTLFELVNSQLDRERVPNHLEAIYKSLLIGDRIEKIFKKFETEKTPSGDQQQGEASSNTSKTVSNFKDFNLKFECFKQLKKLKQEVDSALSKQYFDTYSKSKLKLHESAAHQQQQQQHHKQQQQQQQQFEPLKLNEMSIPTLPDDQRLYKNNITMVYAGDVGTGKTSLMITYLDKSYPAEFVPTIVDVEPTTETIQDKTITYMPWDAAGFKDYNMLRPLCYANADIFMLCYSVENRTSFKHIAESW